jgi:hypothetical protein
VSFFRVEEESKDDATKFQDWRRLGKELIGPSRLTVQDWVSTVEEMCDEVSNGV